ncbi:MAG: lysophospholipid acyltransferase family protein [Burkholderiales bacterium]|nr:MAG: lysophospholipid acyltransferase family protein [Betaproteobacteria bacterium]TAG67607.1 MAG: lysophospholipid acyltransferase family protein [Burkholderiales bacterium]
MTQRALFTINCNFSQSAVATQPNCRLSRFLALFANAVAAWLARRSLRTQARIGAWLGRQILWSKGMKNRLTDNLQTAGLLDRVGLQSAAESAGRLAIETVALWKTPDATLLNRVRVVQGWDQVLALRDQKIGVIFLTPHLATFEMASIFIGSQVPMTAMFRPPKVAWAEPMMRAGRDRLQIKSVPAEMSGIRAMLKALKLGETIGLLPDQVPTSGDGAVGTFFGRPAYTITLVQKLAKTSGATVVMVACKRLADGVGYELQFTPLAPFSVAPEAAANELNRAVEAAIAIAPEQYLWTYNRYKMPAGAQRSSELT